MEEFSVAAGLRFSYNALIKFTDNFSDDNVIVKTQYFNLFRGQFDAQSEQFTIKIWHSHDKLDRFKEEITILGHPRVLNCPNIVKLMGYCCEEDHVASVYKLHSVDTLDNLLDKDEFQWRDRMTAALGITRIFRFFGVHGIGHRIHATLPCYIILDQGSNPVLSDVRVLSGGIMLLNEGRGDSAVGNAACFFGEDATVCQIKPNGIFALGILLLRLAHEECNVLEDVKTKLPYVGRPSSSYSPFNSQMKSHRFFYQCDRLMVPQSDIFALGGLLMSLLCKRDMAVVIRSFIYEHVEERFKSKSSHAHESFVSHPSFDHHDAHNLTKLAMDCLGQDWLLSRPTASEIVERLRSLSLFSNTLLSTNIKVKIIESYAITERKPSWQKNLGLFKKFSYQQGERQG